MSKTAKPKTPLPLRARDFVLLAVLQDGPLHGYALSREMSTRSGGHVAVRPGDLYRILYRLAEQGLVSREPAEGPEERRRARYHLTDYGSTVLRQEAQRLAELTAQVLSHASAGGSS